MSGPSDRVGIGLKLSRGAPIESFRQIWRIADQAGFDHCWAFDHLATTDPDGTHPVLFEGWTLLAAMAEATTRIRIGLLVTGMIYRHPALLAKQAVTVDHLSGGRLEFGIGAGWAMLEHDMFGIGSGDHQVGRLSEGLQLIKLLWTQERSSFDGHHYRLRDAVGNPKPVQRPRPPIWIGASGPMMLRVAAHHADVWNWAGEGLQDAIAAGSTVSVPASLLMSSRSPASAWVVVTVAARPLMVTVPALPLTAIVSAPSVALTIARSAWPSPALLRCGDSGHAEAATSAGIRSPRPARRTRPPAAGSPAPQPPARHGRGDRSGRPHAQRSRSWRCGPAASLALVAASP